MATGTVSKNARGFIAQQMAVGFESVSFVGTSGSRGLASPKLLHHSAYGSVRRGSSRPRNLPLHVGLFVPYFPRTSDGTFDTRSSLSRLASCFGRYGDALNEGLVWDSVRSPSLVLLTFIGGKVFRGGYGPSRAFSTLKLPRSRILPGMDEISYKKGKRNKRRHFSATFKARAVRLARSSSSSTAQVARELQISEKTLYNWLRAEAESQRTTADDQQSGQTLAEPRIAELEAELSRLRRHRAPSATRTYRGPRRRVGIRPKILVCVWGHDPGEIRVRSRASRMSFGHVRVSLPRSIEIGLLLLAKPRLQSTRMLRYRTMRANLGSLRDEPRSVWKPAEPCGTQCARASAARPQVK